LLAYAILLIGTLCFGEATADVKPEIGLPIPGSPAVRAGFLAGDEIVAINGHRMSSGLEILKTIHTSTGRALRITIDRHGSTQTLSVTPQKTKLDDGGTEGTIGFVPVPLYAHVPVGTAIANAGARFLDLLTSQLASYATIFTHPKENVGQLSGVIGMTAEAGVVQDLGWAPYFGLAAMISIALAILNILPFPALDGGRALLIIIEMVRGKALDAKKEALFNATGVFALMLLMLATAYHDIGNILMGKAF
jgi:regulator of sigma E protease